MLKVLCLVDKVGTALDRLAKGVSKYHDNINYVVLDFHPKRPDQRQIEDLKRELSDTDIIDAQYFRTIEKVRELFPEAKNIKTILSMNNPYSIEEQTWNEYDLVVANNQYIYKRLGEITTAPLEIIPLTVDTDFWTFNPRPLEADRKAVIMVANRIESKKGILPVAIAAADIGLKFILVGAVSDPQYLFSVMQTGNVEFHEKISDEALRDLYYKSTIHVCNSVDNYESGTLPILEAMLCGVPVLTREVGHVPELYNGDNMALLKSDSEDVEAITKALQDLAFDKKKLEDMRQAAWNTAKTRSFERRAYQYQKLYRQVLFPDQTPVSIIIPVYDKPEIVRKCLNAIAEQTYNNIEVIVADDGWGDESDDIVDDFSKYVNIPFRYIHTGNNIGAEGEVKDYGLARARNEAAIEATGDILVFCDQRMIMEPDAIEQFVGRMKPKFWLYGNKGAKKDFVENFSAVYRKEFITAGMFNERINRYGGMSQEIRARIRLQGFTTEYVESAKANPTGKSSNKHQKRSDIIAMKNRLFKCGLE